MTIPAENNHPCFNEFAKKRYGRVHLPVAPRCNIQCNYCNRRYDCVNETRPGVTSTIVEPVETVAYLESIFRLEANISVVGIAGPGDAFAEPERTLEALERIRRAYPHVALCLSSNGLNVAPYVDRLAATGVGYVTITVNTVDSAIGEHIYRWVSVGGKRCAGKEAAESLLSRQVDAIRRLKERNITVKINTVVIPGVNDDVEQVGAVAEQAASLGVDLMNIMPLYPVAGTPFGACGQIPRATIAALRKRAAAYVPQMRHCVRCRADAIGKLGDEDGSLRTSHSPACGERG